jgi:ribonuclease HI
LHSLALVTDGACIANPGPGGWAFAFVESGKIVHEGFGTAEQTTNNRMELQAVIEALRFFLAECPDKKSIQVISDSKYVLDAFRQDWISGWKKRGWKTADRKPVKNQDLWQDLISLSERLKIDWQWVKGHSGDPFNDRVDLLAREAAESLLKDLG